MVRDGAKRPAGEDGIEIGRDKRERDRRGRDRAIGNGMAVVAEGTRRRAVRGTVSVGYFAVRGRNLQGSSEIYLVVPYFCLTFVPQSEIHRCFRRGG